jgi:predicted nucleic acid-binding protein
MAEKYYLDTCVWRDFYEDRYGQGGRPLGELASKLFMKLLKQKKPILFSEFNAREMKRDYSEQDINDMLNLLFISGKLQKVQINKKDVQEAKDISSDRNISFGDCLHAVLARNNDTILVTQNVKDFEQLSDIVQFKRPEDLL